MPKDNSERLEPLREDIAAFEKQRVTLCTQHLGKWALFFKTRFKAAFDTQMDAVTAGYLICDGDHFLVKEIQLQDKVIHMRPRFRRV